jgi:hypothetical protein
MQERWGLRRGRGRGLPLRVRRRLRREPLRGGAIVPRKHIIMFTFYPCVYCMLLVRN